MSKSPSIPEKLIKIKRIFKDFRKWVITPLPQTPPLIDQIKRHKAKKVVTEKKEVVKDGKLSPEEAQQLKVLMGMVVGVIIASVIVFIYCGYFYQWGWTGFVKDTTTEVTRERKTETSPIEKFTETTKYQSGKTFWDWLDLLIVPILLAFFGYQVQKRDKEKAAERQAELEREREEQNKLEKERAKRQVELEREIAQDNLAEEAIQKYLDNMAKLLLDKEIRKELFSYVELKSILDEQLRKELSTLSTNDKLNLFDKDNPVRDVARTQTITILRRLEGNKELQERIIAFLKDAKLFEFILQKAHLSEINLSQAYLRTNLQQAWLKRANLQQADLRGAKNLTPKQIKSACFWDKAIYKGEWNWEKKAYVVKEPDNTNFIEELKKDTSSDPDDPVDCSWWEK